MELKVLYSFAINTWCIVWFLVFTKVIANNNYYILLEIFPSYFLCYVPAIIATLGFRRIHVWVRLCSVSRRNIADAIFRLRTRSPLFKILTPNGVMLWRIKKPLVIDIKKSYWFTFKNLMIFFILYVIHILKCVLKIL